MFDLFSICEAFVNNYCQRKHHIGSWSVTCDFIQKVRMQMTLTNKKRIFSCNQKYWYQLPVDEVQAH